MPILLSSMFLGTVNPAASAIARCSVTVAFILYLSWWPEYLIWSCCFFVVLLALEVVYELINNGLSYTYYRLHSDFP